MNNKLLNDMIKYIEEHLTEDIKYKDLAKIVGVSEYTLQRVFVFLVGFSLSEYIRKRRLSKAFEELKTTDIKIIDLAIKYNYESSVSFARAFKKYFNMTPSECRQNNKHYKLFPVCEFEDSNYENINYQIKKVNEKILYCYSVSSNFHDDLLYKIRLLYKKINETGMRNILNKYGMYGISTYVNDIFYYHVGCEYKLKNTKKIIVEKGTYAVFEVGSEKQNDISKIYDFVYSKWLKSTSYEILDKPEIEYYENGNCYIYFMIKDKQN